MNARRLAPALLCFIGSARAQEQPLAPEPPPARPALAEALDQGQEEVSRQVVEVGRRLDRFFGGEDYLYYPEGSTLRIGTTALFEEGGVVSFDGTVKLRLALPNTERRWNLILESNDREDLFGPAQQRPLRNPLSEDSGIAGLRYIDRIADYWNFDTDLGIKLRTPVEPFVESRIAHSWFVGAAELRPLVSAFWYAHDGPGVGIEFIAQGPLPGPRFLSSYTQTIWHADEERFTYSEEISLSHEFSPLHAAMLNVGARGESEPHDRLTAYFVNVRWRKDIYRDWLFLELRPELLYERDSDFTQQARFFVTLEAFFGDINWPGVPDDAQ